MTSFRGWVFIGVLYLAFQGVGWAEQGTAVLKGSDPSGVRPQQALPEVETYEQLLGAIRKVRVESRERIEKVVERENVREAWLTGKLIDTHVLHYRKRAAYGKEVIQKLAQDLASSPTELRYELRFARAFPIQPPAAELSWADWRELLSVKDSGERKMLARKAERENWGRDKLRQEVKRSKGGSGSEAEFLQAQPGKVGTYRVLLAKEGPFKGKLAVDLGFANYHRPEKIDKFKEGDMVVLKKGRLKKISGATDQDRYTYEAYVLQVIDGDSFTAVVDLGFEMATMQTLRLRGLDAPEIEGREGKEAKEFLEKMIVGADPRVRPPLTLFGTTGSVRTPKNIPDRISQSKEHPWVRPLPGNDKGLGPTHGSAPTHEILIRTTKSDKYDRYLADVFVEAPVPGTTEKVPGTDAYLYVNQALVAEGLAVTVQD